MVEVVIVLGERFAPRLGELAAAGPVWALRRGELERAGEADQTAHPHRDGTTSGVTLFNGPHDPEEALVAALDVIDEHLGAHRRASAATQLRVLGAKPTPRISAALSHLGFGQLEPITDGFVAPRPTRPR